jgi:hypothetical protein
MLPVGLDRAAGLRHWFLPDRPGPLVGLHVLQTGQGACWVDRWPDPRAVLVDTAGNWSLAGDPAVLDPGELAARVRGFVEAPDPFVPLLRAAFPDLQVWERVVFALPGRPRPARQGGPAVRRLGPADAAALAGLSAEVDWIGNTWGGPAALAASATAWGAFAGARLVSVACPFFLGQRYEDIGVVTEAELRGRGLSVACARAVCGDVLGRGRTPSWTTSPDNLASVRVAEKLGFALDRHDRLHVTGVAIPTPARPG